jgi:pyrimidine operon attenuation protein/uracil phosphoribosyltransferase
MSTSIIMDKLQIERSINRMAWEILERNHEETELIFAGIDGRGLDLMERLGAVMREIAPSINILKIQISLDKDEPWTKPVSFSPALPQNLDSTPIILIDDVLNSGKTMLYALEPMLKSPTKRITTAVLIERSHKRYPLVGDVVGLRLSTSSHEHVRVVLKEGDEKVYLE